MGWPKALKRCARSAGTDCTRGELRWVKESQTSWLAAPARSETTTAAKGTAGSRPTAPSSRATRAWSGAGSSAARGCFSTTWNSAKSARPTGRQNRNRPAKPWLVLRGTPSARKYAVSGARLPITRADGTA